MAPESGVFGPAVGRIRRTMPWIAGAGAIAAAVHGGWLDGLAFLIGAAAGYFNFTRMDRLVGSLGPGAKPAPAGLYVFFLFRLGLLLGGGYVIVKVFGMNGIAAIAGLFVPLAAAITEALYELIHGT